MARPEPWRNVQDAASPHRAAPSMLNDAALIAALALARLAFGYQFQSLASLGPDLVARFHLDYASLGTLIGLYMLPGIVVALPGGLLGRRFGARAVVGVGLLCMAGGALLAALLFGPVGIAVGRLLSGAGAVAFVVMQGKMVSDRFHGPRFMPVMGLLIGAFPVGAGLVGLTHDLVVGAFGPAGLFWVGAAFPCAALLLFLPSVGATPQTGPRWAFPSRHESALVIVAGLVWTAYNAGYYGFLSYMPSLLAARHHPPALIATVMTVATWSNLPATVLGGALAVRFGAGRVFALATLAGIVAVAGAGLTDWPLAWAILFGTIGSLHPGIIVAVGTLSARPENRAVGMGLFYTTYYLGGTFLPALCGGAADLVHTPAGALLAGAAIATLALPLYALHARMQRAPQARTQRRAA